MKMNMKKMFGTLTVKFAALALVCSLAGGAWGGDSYVTNKVVSANWFGALTVMLAVVSCVLHL